MKIHLLKCAIPAFILSLGACGGDGDIEDFLKLDTAKAKVFETGGDDCDAKAKAVGEWRTANTEKYDKMRKALGEKYKEGPPEKYKEQFKTNSKAVTSNMMKCLENEAFSKMMDESGK